MDEASEARRERAEKLIGNRFAGTDYNLCNLAEILPGRIIKAKTSLDVSRVLALASGKLPDEKERFYDNPTERHTGGLKGEYLHGTPPLSEAQKKALVDALAELSDIEMADTTEAVGEEIMDVLLIREFLPDKSLQHAKPRLDVYDQIMFAENPEGLIKALVRFSEVQPRPDLSQRVRNIVGRIRTLGLKFDFERVREIQHSCAKACIEKMREEKVKENAKRREIKDLLKKIAVATDDNIKTAFGGLAFGRKSLGLSHLKQEFEDRLDAFLTTLREIVECLEKNKPVKFDVEKLMPKSVTDVFAPWNLPPAEEDTLN